MPNFKVLPASFCYSLSLLCSSKRQCFNDTRRWSFGWSTCNTLSTILLLIIVGLLIGIAFWIIQLADRMTFPALNMAAKAQLIQDYGEDSSTILNKFRHVPSGDALLECDIRQRPQKMPFKIGKAPLRRTLYYLEQGPVVLRNDVAVLHIGNDGREVMFDLENKNKDEIVDMIQGTLGKTALVNQREFLEKMQDQNPAEFGSNCKRQCMCEIQGQVPCTGLIEAPDYMKGKFRWNHNLL
ncbi:28S ribosomal protein S25, mitochondrial [Aphelenchoides bicaudatus]|nr:28S ribosomal protein S25, mitochondrial [Aphelenchoides bicaudatus]